MLVSSIRQISTLLPLAHRSTTSHFGGIFRQNRTMSSSSSSSSRTALVIGGNGALGEAVVDAFRAAGWKTLSAGFKENAKADSSIVFAEKATMAEQIATMKKALTGESTTTSSSSSTRLNAVICTAGGWVGGSAADEKIAESISQMQQMCVEPAVAAAHIAALYLQPAATDASSGADAPTISSSAAATPSNTRSSYSGGFLLLTGSAAALHPTPGMLAYGMAKASTHFLVQSLAVGGGGGESSASSPSGLPKGAHVLGLLPKTIDTPSNRKWMAGPGVDTSAWTPPADIANAFVRWAEMKYTGSGSGSSSPSSSSMSLPPSGSLVVANTADGKTSFEVV